MAEAGVLMGGAARLICEAKGDAPLHLFDVFEGLQSPASAGATPREMELRGHFGSVHGDRLAVETLLKPYPGVRVHPGIFPTTTAGLENERFAFVHLDLDLEESTRDALDFFLPRMIAGGIILGDDYQDEGVRRAFAYGVARHGGALVELPWAQAMVVKVAPSARPARPSAKR